MNVTEKFSIEKTLMQNGQDVIGESNQRLIANSLSLGKNDLNKNSNLTVQSFLNKKRTLSPEKENSNCNCNNITPALSLLTKNTSSLASCKKDRNIIDYFKPYQNQNNPHQNPKLQLKRQQSKSQQQLIHNDSYNHIKQEDEVNYNNNMDNTLIQKERVIMELRQQLLDKENEIITLENNYQNEIKKVNSHLINSLKECEQTNRINLKYTLHHQKMKIGQQNTIRTITGQFIDVWDDGEEYIKIKSRLEEIQTEKNFVEKEKAKLPRSLSSDSSSSYQEDKKDLLVFQYLNLIKEEVYLKNQLDQIDHEKIRFMIQDNLFTEETKCYFNSKSKTPWPLLNNRFQILSLLGKGGYSEVYKAYDIKEHNLVACKVFLINQAWPKEIYENYIKHTFREIQIQKHIKHNKVVGQITSFDIDGISYCTVLEYCTGPDLGTYMKLNKNIKEQEAQKIIKQILLGLEYLNKQKHKIIHYDLKPQNILFHNHEVKISDFGISKIVHSNSNEEGGDITQLTSQGIGTYWYLPPECFEVSNNVKISHKVDIWSIGVILFEMLFGKKPFGNGCSHNKLIGIMLNARKVPFPVVPIISDECKEFIQRCLSWKIEDRFDVFEALKCSFITKGLNAIMNTNESDAD